MTQKLFPGWQFPGAPGEERCQICGGLSVCPGPPPENQVSEDEGLEFEAFAPGESVPAGWCGGHFSGGRHHYHRDRPGYAHLHVRSRAAQRMEAHGWAHSPAWVGMCDYVVVYKVAEAEA
jgi:hypothetical protein